MEDKKEALILVGHGSRLPFSKELIQTIAEKIRAKNEYEVVEYGMMEFNTPTIKDAVEAAIAKGSKRLIVVPVFLAPGNHSERDIPTILGLAPTEKAAMIIAEGEHHHDHHHEHEHEHCHENDHEHEHEHCHEDDHEHEHHHEHHHHDHKSDAVGPLPEGVEIVYRGTIGADDKIVDIVLERAKGQ